MRATRLVPGARAVEDDRVHGGQLPARARRARRRPSPDQRSAGRSPGWPTRARASPASQCAAGRRSVTMSGETGFSPRYARAHRSDDSAVCFGRRRTAYRLAAQYWSRRFLRSHHDGQPRGGREHGHEKRLALGRMPRSPARRLRPPRSLAHAGGRKPLTTTQPWADEPRGVVWRPVVVPALRRRGRAIIPIFALHRRRSRWAATTRFTPPDEHAAVGHRTRDPRLPRGITGSPSPRPPVRFLDPTETH